MKVPKTVSLYVLRFLISLIIHIKKKTLFTMNPYTHRYVRLVEAGVHEALTLCEGGRPGARTRRAARVPPNLHAALAARPTAPFARALLAATLPTHYKVRFSWVILLGPFKARLNSHFFGKGGSQI